MTAKEYYKSTRMVDTRNWTLEMALNFAEEYTEALRKHAVSGSSFEWDKFANALKDEFGESLVEEEDGEDDAYNWWLTDVTVTDIIDFLKNYR